MASRAPLVFVAALAGACGSAAVGYAEHQAGLDGGLEAQAQGEDSGAPSAATEMCSQAIGAYLYAEHAYPGRTAAELAGVRALAHVVESSPRVLPATYAYDSVGFSTRDGYVAAYCGPSSSPFYDAVSFTGP